MKKFEAVEHTADLALRILGPDLPKLYENAAEGLLSLLIDPGTLTSPAFQERVVVEGKDPEDLLVRWLNEIVFLVSVQNMVFSSFRILKLTKTHLEAELTGELRDPLRHPLLREIKSATYHSLKIAPHGPGGWTTTVVFDV